MSIPRTPNAIELTIDPAVEDFTGAISTELEITAPLDVLWLDGNEIRIDDAKLVVGGERIALQPTYRGKDLVGLVLPRTIARPGWRPRCSSSGA